MQQLVNSTIITRLSVGGLVARVPVVQLIRQASGAACTDPAHKKEDAVTPSGWVPPSVKRSRMNNLPVYLDYRNGRSRILTQIRKIDGDVLALERMLREHLNEKKLLTRVDDLTGTVVLHGNYREEVKLWLVSLGF